MESNLEARSRDTFGKNAARRTRAAGWIPAVVYGGHSQGERPVGHPISVDPKALHRILHSGSGVNTLIGLTVDDAGEPTRVLVREYQIDPVTHALLHADFYRVAMDKLLTVTVPIVLRGEAQGVKLQGGVVDFVSRDIEVECLPADIPDEIVVDISELMIGEALRVRDLPASDRWKALSEPELMLVHVVAPRAEAEPTEEEAAAAAVAATETPAEPEVIKKGKAEKAEKAEED